MCDARRLVWWLCTPTLDARHYPTLLTREIHCVEQIETFGTAMEEVSEVFQQVGNVTSVRLVRDFRNHQVYPSFLSVEGALSGSCAQLF